jgi:hypothetical protein
MIEWTSIGSGGTPWKTQKRWESHINIFRFSSYLLLVRWSHFCCFQSVPAVSFDAHLFIVVQRTTGHQNLQLGQITTIKNSPQLTHIFDFSERILLQYVQSIFCQSAHPHRILLISFRSLILDDRMELNRIRWYPLKKSKEVEVSHQYFSIF